MSKANHSPWRTCLGCMQRDAKARMLRVASDGVSLVVDAGGRAKGRGGYLHRRNECITRFTWGKTRYCRSLGRKLSLAERLKMAELTRAWLDSPAGLK